MRKMKKALATVLVFVMLLSSFAFAAELPTNYLVIGDKAVDLNYAMGNKEAFNTLLTNYLNSPGGDVKNLYMAIAEKFQDVYGKDLTATEIEAIKAQLITLYNSENPTGTPLATDTLKVVSVSAINKTTIKVEFSKAVDAVAASNFTVKVGEAVKTIDAVALNTDKKIATLTVQGLNYEDNVTVMVTGIKAGAETLADTTVTTKVPALGELYQLKISCNAENNTIKSDGATKTMLTAELIEKATNNVVDLDGVVQFSATKGGLAQTEVTLTDGKASVVLTSAASDVSIISYITAIVVDAPGASEYEGLTGQFEVIFAPEGVDPGTVTFVSLRYAESNQGDRFFATFSNDITVEDFKKAVMKSKGVTTWAAAIATGNIGIQINGNMVDIIEVHQKSANTLEFILNTDSHGATKSIVPATNQIRSNPDWPAAATPNYLRDNNIHVVTIPLNIGEKVLADTTGVSFIMTDAKRPFIYGVTVENQLKFHVRFSESMAEDLVEGAAGAINPHFLLDGKKVRYIAAPTPVQVQAAIAANEVIVTELYVGNYTEDEGYRKNVYFEMYRDFALAGGAHIIQIANVGDWAAMVDTNNMVSTQTFDFSVTPDLDKPVATIEVQSPEQWKITWNKVVSTKGAMTDAIDVFRADSATQLVYGANPANPATDDYEIATYVEDGKSVWLFETVKDWTEYYGTQGSGENYWNSVKNPYKVVINAGEVLDGLANACDKIELPVTIALDGTSPKIVSAVDASTVNNLIPSGQEIIVTMDEPVQVEDASGAPSTVQMTPSEQQTALVAGAQYAAANVPQPTFEFVKGDTTVEGQIKNGSIGREDFEFTVEPAGGLTPGEWKLYIRNLTDDVGNSYDTTAYSLIVPETAPVVSDTKVAWVGFDNGKLPGANKKDYLYVKFTKVMDPTGPAGVSRTTQYVFNAKELPEGSQVYRGIPNVTNEWDGVTIEMPAGAFIGTAGVDGLNGDLTGVVADYVDDDHTSVLNVSNLFKAADGTALSGPYEVQLVDQAGASLADKDSFPDAGPANPANLEALYINASASIVMHGQPVMMADAQDAAGNNGKIDQITLTFPAAITTTAADTIWYDGKEFVNTTLASNAVQVFARAADDLSVNTATVGKKVTTEGGAIYMGLVDDQAKPVIVLAKATVGAKTLVLTFSEKVFGSTAGTKLFQAADLTYTNTSAGDATAIATFPVHTVPTATLTVEVDVNFGAPDVATATADTVALTAAATDSAGNTGNTTAIKITN